MLKKQLTPQVLIIGAGVTGTGIARDLALRGIVALVIEQGNINDGASGRNHGLLHSGARYVGSDPDSAAECAKESKILKKIASHCIEETGGLYVAVKGDDESYIADFPNLCKAAGIVCQPLSIQDALALEPGLSKEIIAAFRVDDASVDPFHLSLENMNQAIEHGGVYYSNCQAIGVVLEENHGKKSIGKVRVRNNLTGDCFNITPQVVINAAGVWAGMVAQMAGICIDMIYSKGSLLVTHNRLTNHVINRLRPACDGDILVPGRTVSIFGTTSVRLDNLDTILPEFDEVDFLVEQGTRMVPGLETARYIRAYAGVRPLVSSPKEIKGDDRAVSRGFYLFDHEKDQVDNFITITGGKVTTYRLMAEKACDVAAQKLKVSTPCTTATTPLMSKAPSNLIEAGMSVKLWAKASIPGDSMMCECEMVPKSHFKELILWLKQNRETADLNSLRIHSRLGKGACQGTFCSMRVTGLMYDEAYIKDSQGLDNIKFLLDERFKGQKPVLWDNQLAQAELNEAMFCSFFGLDLIEPDLIEPVRQGGANGK